MTQPPPDVAITTTGVLFDCDGVLVDSDASVLTAWTRWAHQYGQDPDTIGDKVHGRRAADTVAALVGPDQQKTALTAINAYEVQGAETVTEIPGAATLVTSIPIDRWAVVTSGNRLLATARLAAAAIPNPAVMITADDVVQGKPHPEGYRLAAHRLGLTTDHTVVFEDAPSGVLAARAAGVATVIGVGQRALDTDADIVVRDLRGITWTDNGLSIAKLSILRPARP